MIVELVGSESDDPIGRFQSPAIPRRGEELSYAGQVYVVESVSWGVENHHNHSLDTVCLFVRPAES